MYGLAEDNVISNSIIIHQTVRYNTAYMDGFQKRLCEFVENSFQKNTMADLQLIFNEEKYIIQKELKKYIL